MNNEEKIEAAGKKKEEGNALFKAGKYVRASKRYEKVNISSLSCHVRCPFDMYGLHNQYSSRPPNSSTMTLHLVRTKRSRRKH